MRKVIWQLDNLILWMKKCFWSTSITMRQIQQCQTLKNSCMKSRLLSSKNCNNLKFHQQKVPIIFKRICKVVFLTNQRQLWLKIKPVRQPISFLIVQILSVDYLEITLKMNPIDLHINSSHQLILGANREANWKPILTSRFNMIRLWK